MAATSPTEERRLRPDYYVRNYETVLREVRARYGDLLTPSEAALCDAFEALPENAKRIFVRMHTRQGPWFRRDGLVYVEIDDTPTAIDHLLAAGFAIAAELATVEEMLPLLRREDFVTLLETAQVPFRRSARRQDLEALLCTSLDAPTLALRLREHLKPVAPAHADLNELLFFLFFGNGEQGLTDFVLADLGLTRYESYPLSHENRIFTTREEVDFLLDMAHERAWLDEHAHEEAALLELAERVLPREKHPGVRQQRRFMRLLNELGRSLERMGRLDRAEECYLRSGLPPARERLARIHMARGELESACAIAITIADSPLSTPEESFARSLLRRLAKKSPRAKAWCEANPVPPAVPDVSFTVKRMAPDGVEATALALAGEQGWQGFFTENSLWNALFGLAFWDPLFLPLPGAFAHRFQDAPLDLGSPGFFERRRSLFEEHKERFQNPSVLRAQVLERFHQKGMTSEGLMGVANRFVAWRWLDAALLECALDAIPHRALLAVLETMMKSPTEFDNGFPDLFLYRRGEAGQCHCELWEVKGPGDSLRPEQERWIRVFNEHGLTARVAWVKIA